MGLDGSSSDDDMPQRGPADSNDEDSPDEDFVAPKDASDDDDDDDDDDEDGSGSDEEEEKPKKKKVRYTYVYGISRVPPLAEEGQEPVAGKEEEEGTCAASVTCIARGICPTGGTPCDPLAEEAQS